MVIDFKKVDSREQPPLILIDASENKIGVINNVKDLKLTIRYNEMSQIEFSVPEYVDGIRTTHYDDITGLRMVELKDIGRFVLVKPKEVRDGISTTKSCTGYSLEYELTYKKITLENDTYNFYNPVADHTAQTNLIDIILSMLPSWSVGEIDSEMWNKYRTFEVSNENIYNFIKGTVQESYNCIFDFDTFTRTINVRSAKFDVPTKQVFLSNNNLAKEITVEEDTDNIVTKLDVNGADGVDIRDVNPDGSNAIINLDFYMNTAYFPQTIIDKFNSWKATYEGFRQRYYDLSVEHSLQVMKRVTESAKLETLNGDKLKLDSEKSVMMQGGIWNNPTSQSDINKKNDLLSRISQNSSQITSTENAISSISSDIESILTEMGSINSQCRFSSFFTETELTAIDHYIKEDSVSESSFAAIEKDFASASDESGAVGTKNVIIRGLNSSNIVRYKNKANTKWVYSITGGQLVIPDGSDDWIRADIIRATFDMPLTHPGDIMFTAVLGNGNIDETSYRTACISISGNQSSGINSDGSFNVGGNEVPFNGSYVNFWLLNGFLYFTMDTSEYQRHSVSWDLFDYGYDVLQKISQPSYSFSVTSANFFSLDEFTSFKHHVSLGDKIYLEIYGGSVLKPILIGATISYNDYSSLELEFGDKYVSSDNAFQLADLLEQSVSMGKSVDVSRFTYSAFVDSGAKTAVGEFMKSALDVSKNAILSTTGQALTIDESGLRLRKWTDNSHTAYDVKQLWASNNCIMMTRDGWNTAEMAIGEISDGNGGTLYGVVADCVIGKLLAGNSLIIESTKTHTDGGVTKSNFIVDGNGCSIYNCQLELSQDGGCRIRLNPEDGITIFKNNSTNDSDRVFYADGSGNLNLVSNITSASATFKPSNPVNDDYYSSIENGDFKVGFCEVNNGTTSYHILGQFDHGKEGARPDGTSPLLRPDASHVGLVATKNATGLVFGVQPSSGGVDLIMVIRNRNGNAGDDGLRNWVHPTCDVVMACSLAVEWNLFVGSYNYSNPYVPAQGEYGTIVCSKIVSTGTISGSLSNVTGSINGVTGTFSGTSNGTFTGSLSNATGSVRNITGTLNGVTGTFKGDIGDAENYNLLVSSQRKYVGDVYTADGSHKMWDSMTGVITAGTKFGHLISESYTTGNAETHLSILRGGNLDSAPFALIMGFGVGSGGASRPRIEFRNGGIPGYLWMNGSAELYWSYSGTDPSGNPHLVSHKIQLGVAEYFD